MPIASWIIIIISLIETPEGNLQKGMRQLNGIYAQHFNQKHQRVGHLLQGSKKNGRKGLNVALQDLTLIFLRNKLLNPNFKLAFKVRVKHGVMFQQ